MPLRLLCFFRAMRSQIAKRRSSNEASVSYEGRLKLKMNWRTKKEIPGESKKLSRIKIIQVSSHQIHPNTASATKSDTPTSPTPCFFSILHSFSVSFPSFPSSLHQWSCLKGCPDVPRCSRPQWESLRSATSSVAPVACTWHTGVADQYCHAL